MDQANPPRAASRVAQVDDRSMVVFEYLVALVCAAAALLLPRLV